MHSSSPQFSTRSNIHTLNEYPRLSIPFSTPKEYLLFPTILFLYYTVPLVVDLMSITTLFVLAIYNLVLWSGAFYLCKRNYNMMTLLSCVALSMVPILSLNAPFREVSLLRTIGTVIFYLLMEDALSNSVSTIIKRFSLSYLSDYLGRTSFPGMRVSPLLESLILAVITNFLGINISMSFITTPLLIGKYLHL